MTNAPFSKWRADDCASHAEKPNTGAPVDSTPTMPVSRGIAGARAIGHRLAAALALTWFLGAIGMMGEPPLGETGASARRASASDDPAPAARLIDGVAEIAAPGVPGPLCVWGDAFAVAVGASDGATVEPVAAAAQWGAGRVVAFGHGGYAGRASLESADTGRLMENALAWVAGAEIAAGRIGGVSVGFVGGADGADWLAERGWSVVAAEIASLGSLDAVVIRPWNHTEAELEALAEFARSGGGLILPATGWGWAQLHPDRDLARDFAGNRLLAEVGIQWPYAWLGRTSESGYAVDGPPSPLTNGNRALEAVEAETAGGPSLSAAERDQASTSLIRAASCAPAADRLLLPKLEPYLSEMVIPTAEEPVKRSEVMRRVAVVMQSRALAALPAREAVAHPAGQVFPGPVPEGAPRVRRRLEIDAAVPDWHSTGLYAPPGEPLRLSLSPAAADLGLKLRVGAHSDALWHADTWRRMPEISMLFDLDEAEVEVASPYGGLIYIIAPRGLVETASAMAAVSIEGAIEAPRFVLGETDPDQWRAVLRHHPAPWAEIGSDKMIVTVPSSSVRDLEDPVALAATWDRIMDLCAELADLPKDRVQPERFVTDEQISVGYMHAGYPLMAHLDVRRALVDREHLLAGNWGMFHEVGHNHQSGAWTFAGTTEVTVNLFTLYVYEHLVGIPVAEHERGSEDFVAAQLAKYDFDAPEFARWQADPFLALTIYVQLQHEFGWDAYRRAFAAYHELDPTELPTDDAGKRDLWLTTFSRVVGRDLGPFFEAWGVPTSASIRAALADLPAWLPAGFPPAGPVAPTATAIASSPTPPITPPPTETPTSTASPTPDSSVTSVARSTPSPTPTRDADDPTTIAVHLPLAWRAASAEPSR